MDISSSSYNWSKDSDITSKSPFLGFKQNLDIICAQYYGMQRPMWEGKKKEKKPEEKGVLIQMAVFPFQKVSLPGATEQKG